MPPLFDVNNSGVADFRPYVVVKVCSPGKGGEAVKLCDNCGRCLYPASCLCHFSPDLLKQLILQGKPSFLGSEDFCLYLLDFRGYVSFRPDKCLFSDIIVRDLGSLGFGHFKVVAKDLVISHLEA